MGERPVSGAVRTHKTFIKFEGLYGRDSAAQNNYKSNIKDPWSQITVTNTIIMKKFEIVQELRKCDTETWSVQMLLKK